MPPPSPPTPRSLSNMSYDIFGAKRVKTVVDTYLVYVLNCVQFSKFDLYSITIKGILHH